MIHWDRVGLTVAPDTSDVDLSGVTTTGKCENPSQPFPTLTRRVGMFDTSGESSRRGNS